MSNLEIYLITIGASWLLLALVAIITKILSKKGGQAYAAFAIAEYFIGFAAAVITLYLVLKIAGLDTFTAAAAVGITAIIFGLAMQNVFEDLFTGILLLFEVKYQKGDIVTANGFRGVVMEIGPRTLTLYDKNRTIQVIHNADMRNYQVYYWNEIPEFGEAASKKKKSKKTKAAAPAKPVSDSEIKDVSETAEEVKEAAAGTAEDIKEATEEIKEKAEKTAEDVSETVETAAEDIQEEASAPA